MLSSLVLGPAQLPASQRTPEDHTVSKPFDIFVVNISVLYLMNIVCI